VPKARTAAPSRRGVEGDAEWDTAESLGRAGRKRKEVMLTSTVEGEGAEEETVGFTIAGQSKSGGGSMGKGTLTPATAAATSDMVESVSSGVRASDASGGCGGGCGCVSVVVLCVMRG
jgi:hypothetical protein